jgi:hypothetical protein
MARDPKQINQDRSGDTPRQTDETDTARLLDESNDAEGYGTAAKERIGKLISASVTGRKSDGNRGRPSWRPRHSRPARFVNAVR